MFNVRARPVAIQRTSGRQFAKLLFVQTFQQNASYSYGRMRFAVWRLQADRRFIKILQKRPAQAMSLVPASFVLYRPGVELTIAAPLSVLAGRRFPGYADHDWSCAWAAWWVCRDCAAQKLPARAARDFLDPPPESVWVVELDARLVQDAALDAPSAWPSASGVRWGVRLVAPSGVRLAWVWLALSGAPRGDPVDALPGDSWAGPPGVPQAVPLPRPPNPLPATRSRSGLHFSSSFASR
jgi:hypothetical protein